ncbi:MAG: DUF5685 family protein [Lachnospiraceae bacterium]|nr:DUF5685 family protein [Lachnospiraceae bacterium]
MFGYIQVNRQELNETDTVDYQAYYCGLCRELSRIAGWRGRFALNYDMTFLIILLSGLYELEHEDTEFTCVIHPTKRRLAYRNEATTYCAKMNVVLAYHNLMDDYYDTHDYKKLQMAKAYKKAYLKIKEEYPNKVAAVEQMMEEIQMAEARCEENLDLVSGYMGNMLGELFVWKTEDIWADDLRAMGYYMGKFIYMMDAYDDMAEDEKHRNYNPFLIKKQKNPECSEVFCQQILESMVSECAKAFECMPILQHASILRNILYSGIWTKYEYKQIKLGRRETKE